MAGGWALAIHDTDDQPRTLLFDTATTLRALHRACLSQPEDSASHTPVTRWLTQTLIDLYNPTIEAEAAARLIVALGAPAPLSRATRSSPTPRAV